MKEARWVVWCGPVVTCLGLWAGSAVGQEGATPKLTEQQMDAFVRIWPDWQRADAAGRARLASGASLDPKVCETIERLINQVRREVAAAAAANSPHAAGEKMLLDALSRTSPQEMQERMRKDAERAARDAAGAAERQARQEREETRRQLERDGAPREQLKHYDELVAKGEAPTVAEQIVKGASPQVIEFFRDMAKKRAEMEKRFEPIGVAQQRGALRGAGVREADLPAVPGGADPKAAEMYEKMAEQQARFQAELVKAMVGAAREQKEKGEKAAASQPVVGMTALRTLAGQQTEAANLELVRKYARRLGIEAPAAPAKSDFQRSVEEKLRGPTGDGK